MWSTRTNVRFNKRFMGIHARQKEILAGANIRCHAIVGRLDSAHSGVGRSAVHLHPVLACPSNKVKTTEATIESRGRSTLRAAISF